MRSSNTNSETKRIFNMWMCPIRSVSVPDRRRSGDLYRIVVRANVRKDSRSGSTVGDILRDSRRSRRETRAGHASRCLRINRKRRKFERGINSLSVKIIRIQYRIFVLAGYERNER